MSWYDVTDYWVRYRRHRKKSHRGYYFPLKKKNGKSGLCWLIFLDSTWFLHLSYPSITWPAGPQHNTEWSTTTTTTTTTTNGVEDQGYTKPPSPPAREPVTLGYWDDQQREGEMCEEVRRVDIVDLLNSELTAHLSPWRHGGGAGLIKLKDHWHHPASPPPHHCQGCQGQQTL